MSDREDSSYSRDAEVSGNCFNADSRSIQYTVREEPDEMRAQVLSLADEIRERALLELSAAPTLEARHKVVAQMQMLASKDIWKSLSVLARVNGQHEPELFLASDIKKIREEILKKQPQSVWSDPKMVQYYRTLISSLGPKIRKILNLLLYCPLGSGLTVDQIIFILEGKEDTLKISSISQAIYGFNAKTSKRLDTGSFQFNIRRGPIISVTLKTDNF